MEHNDGTNGVDLSGGQWQRLALARNFYRDSPIIILDEPTSAIDALAESRIFKRLF
jgi:ATP-binding cassette subfamily B protein